MAKKYYVVWVGRNPGIYTSWEACSRQTSKFPGAKHRAYNTYTKAHNAFYNIDATYSSVFSVASTTTLHSIYLGDDLTSPSSSTVPLNVAFPVPPPVNSRVEPTGLYQASSYLSSVAEVDKDLIVKSRVEPMGLYQESSHLNHVAEVDEDFVDNNIWTSALHFAGTTLSNTTLGSIARKVGVKTYRVAQVVALIKECTPTSLRDTKVTLKDPTGTVEGNIHHKVFHDEKWKKKIGVGAAMVLKEVVVISPNHSTHYLNIMHANVLQVLAKDEFTQENSQPRSTHVDTVVTLVNQPTKSNSNPGTSNQVFGGSLAPASSSLFNFSIGWTDEEINSIDFSEW